MAKTPSKGRPVGKPAADKKAARPTDEKPTGARRADRGASETDHGDKPPAARPSGPGMDELSAHLDRGWDLLQRSDFPRAQLSAERILEIDEHSPEAYTLLGAIAAAQGRAQEALAHYEHAMELDSEYVDPLLYAAEVHLWSLGDPEEAVRLCQQALELCEEEDEYLDALLLKAEAEIGMGDEEAAQATMADLPEVDLPEPSYHLRAGRTLLDLQQVDDAEHHYRKALDRDNKLTEALHGLGLCAEQREERQAMVRYFLRVRELDLKEPEAPWGVSAERFEELCNNAHADLPERIRTLLQNVPVMAADYPTEDLIIDGTDPRVLGFFAGVPFPEKTTVGGNPHLDCIFLYQRNIERVARTVEEVEEEIKVTLVHEAGHFFGLSEEDLDELGLS